MLDRCPMVGQLPLFCGALLYLGRQGVNNAIDLKQERMNVREHVDSHSKGDFH